MSKQDKKDMLNKNRRRFGPAEIVFYIVYLVGISYAMMYVVARGRLALCGAAMSAVSIGVGALFYFLRNKKLLSFLVAAVLSFGCLALLGTVRLTGDENFMDFVFTSSTFFNPYYAFVTIACFGSVIGFAVCFFAAYSPRPGFMMLPMLIPLILASRTSGGVPEWILITMLAGFVMSAAGLSRLEIGADRFLYDKSAQKTGRLAIAAVGAAAALLLAIIPRSDDTPAASKLDDAFGGRTGGYYMGSPTLTNFVANSSVNRGTNSPQGNFLFALSGDNPVYLTRWSFDLYDGEKGWVTLEDYDTGYSGWESAAQSTDPAIFVYKLRNAAQAGLLSDYAELIDSLAYSRVNNIPILNEVFSPAKQCAISVRDGSDTSVILHPESVFEAVTKDRRDTYRTMRGEIFTRGNMGENAMYTLRFFADEPNDTLAAALSKTDLYELSTAAYHAGVISSVERDAYVNAHNFAEKYFGQTADSGMTEKISRLAEKITEGLSTDYEKAMAIERWFSQSGFVYDLKFVPKTSEAEYFLFDSKRGICSDFATATTLLARAAGLSARYTEGYLITEEMRAEDGTYHVTDAATHAYTTVYIDGCGWINLDATKYVPQAQDNTGKFKLAATIAAAVLLVLAALFVIFRRKLSELLFSVTRRFMSTEKAVRKIFLRTRTLACEINGADEESATVGEVCGVIAKALGLRDESERMQNAFDELFYGSGKISADKNELYKDYREAVRMKRRLKK